MWQIASGEQQTLILYSTANKKLKFVRFYTQKIKDLRLIERMQKTQNSEYPHNKSLL